jgi:hypothetical protein
MIENEVIQVQYNNIDCRLSIVEEQSSLKFPSNSALVHICVVRNNCKQHMIAASNMNRIDFESLEEKAS